MSLGDYTPIANDDPHDNIRVMLDGDERVILLCNVSVYALRLSVSAKDIVAVGKAILAVVSGKKARKKLKLSGGGVFAAFRGHKKEQTFLEFDLSFFNPDFEQEADAEVLYTGFEADELTEFAERLCGFDGDTVSVRKIRKGQLL